MSKILKLLFIILPIIVTEALKCESVDNQPCLARETIVNINNNEPRYYPFAIKLNKCTGSCDDLGNPFAKICEVNETRKRIIKVYDILFNKYWPMVIKEDVSCDCQCKFNSSVCKGQRWNKNKCRCECDRQRCRRGFVWDYSVCSCRNERSDAKVHNYSLSNLNDVCDDKISVTTSSTTNKNHMPNGKKSIDVRYIIAISILVLILISVLGVVLYCYKRTIDLLNIQNGH